MSYRIKKRSILIGSNQSIKNIEPLIAKKLKQKLKIKTIFIPKTKEDEIYYKKNFSDCFDEVYHNNFKINADYLKHHKKYKDPIKKALEFENKYNISIFRLFITDRVLGRGFHASGGVRHPRNRTQQLYSHKDFLNMAINYISFWENLFVKENVQYTINLDTVSHHIAIKNKIKSYKLYDGRFKTTFSWVNHTRLDPEVSEKDIKKNFNRKKITIDRPQQAYMVVRKVDTDNLKLLYTVKNIIYNLLQISYGKIKGYEKSRNKYLFDEISYLWRYRSDYKLYKKKSTFKLDKYKNKKFIFFPLLTEPEIAIHGIADDFFFQLSAINLISRDLPADYILVVKEHVIAFGRRPKDFYKQITDLNNVFLADPNEFGLDYVKKCKAVACITGTAAWEALVMGVPVISFSKHNTFNFLDHVYFVKNFDSLREIFLSIEKEKYPNKKSVKNGSAFYNAYLNKLVEVEDYNYLIPLSNDVKNISKNMKDVAEVIFQSLLNKMKNSC